MKQTIIDYLVAGLLGAAMALTFLPSILRDGRQYCDQGYVVCVERPK